ncbi:hypothetical protein DFH09DRAFT_1273185 [Mycena vulgaris]|nr:hypothetical protein DFH09DRAFT_1273185 [Mycena vulgaris]
MSIPRLCHLLSSTVTMPLPVVLLDLPTEILLQIIENPVLSGETVYSLALLCRRLHFIALPVYFTREGLDSDSQAIRLTLSKNGRDLLTALRTALFNFFPLVNTLTCIFPHPSCISILPFLEHLNRVEGFIAGAPTLKHVALQLDAQGSMCHSVGSDDALRSWACHLGNLLNCIVEKGCTSLTIAHGGYFTKAYELSTTNKYVRPFLRYQGQIRALLSARRTETCDFRRAPQQGEQRIELSLPLNCSSASRLTTLHIQSAILLLPPGLGWTLDALRTCPVSSMTFSKLVVSPPVWGAVLPLISSAAAKLTSVSFLAVDGITGVDIASFAASLPHLTHLRVDAGVSVIPRSVGLRPPHLTHLASLHATPDFIRWILSRKDSLSTLRELIVKFLSVGIDETVIQHLSSIIRALDARKLTPSISLEIHSILWSRTSSPSFSTDVRMSLDRIAGLEIILEQFQEADVKEMASVIAIFRRARRVAISVEFPTRALRAIAVKLARSIPSTEGLQMIQINGAGYTLASQSSPNTKPFGTNRHYSLQLPSVRRFGCSRAKVSTEALVLNVAGRPQASTQRYGLPHPTALVSRQISPSLASGTNGLYAWEGPTSHYQSLVIGHALLCVLGFAILLPAGAILARYMRIFRPWWYTAHWVVQVGIAGPVVVIGVVLGYLANHEYGEIPGDDHKVYKIKIYRALNLLNYFAFVTVT